ncbi:hypothetical protein [Halomonas sp. CKK8]|uniref:hypothetical protein n=1 Tax=Halomonas sp. CKK8 TaxID=3036127 RepID=UPI0024152544|nr:hypothetical protein [Halomonas sp. CKK8]WFM72977.1 hypothetical protein P8934_08265 [Halomonas sp. CKK8]
MPSESNSEFDQLESSSNDGTDESDAYSKSAMAAEEAYKELDAVKDKLKEERFLFVLAGLVLLNAHILGNMDNWAAPVVIGILQIFGLLIFARRSGVEEVQQLLDKLLDAVKPGR